MQKYDAIVIGAGHNGLTNAAYLAKAGLDVLVVEKNDYIGGAAVSRELYPDWKYSNCSYVCSLLRPEIMRDLQLPRHGLQVVPYGGGVTFMQNGDYYGNHADHERQYREIARHSKRDANAYDRYEADVMKQTRLIRPFLMRTPPDPTSLKPKDLKELALLASSFGSMGEEGLADTMRFWTMSIGDFLDEYFESDVIKAHLAGSGIIGTALGGTLRGRHMFCFITIWVMLMDQLALGDLQEAVWEQFLTLSHLHFNPLVGRFSVMQKWIKLLLRMEKQPALL